MPLLFEFLLTFRYRLHDAYIHNRLPAVRLPVDAQTQTKQPCLCPWSCQLARAPLPPHFVHRRIKICLDYHDGRKGVWRKHNERFRDCFVAEHDRFVGGSVLVLAGISFDVWNALFVVLNRSVIGLRYSNEILAPFVAPYAGAVGQ